MHVQPNIHRQALCHKIATVCAITVILIGGAGCLGWILNSDLLKRIHPSLVTMKFNTAVCFVAGGLSLWLQLRETSKPFARAIARCLALFVGAVGVLTLVEVLSGADFGIDQLMFHESLAEAGQSFPGRMGFASTMAFTCCGISLAWLDGKILGRYWSNWFAGAASVFIALVFLYYFYGVEQFEAIARYATIALHSCVAFFCLCLGIFLARPMRGAMLAFLGDGPGSVVARRMLLPAVVLPLLVGWLRLVGQHAGLYSVGFGRAIFALAVILIFTVLIWWTARALDRADAARSEQARQLRETEERFRAELQKHAANLEHTVAERTLELKETNEQLEAFVYSIAHDLRAPLRAMQGFSEILIQDEPALAPQSKTFLTKIHHSAEYMDKMILDLLAFGRTSRSEVRLTCVDIKTVWEAAVYQCSAQIEQAGAIIEAPGPFPAVRAQEAILTQTLANLLSNAIKFVEPGTTPRVLFRWEDTGHSVRLWIEDNGVGIDAKYHERIFRVFERLHGHKYPGTGIGLSIVRKGVERMNGNVGLDSQVGKGTRFWIELPKG
ncbi:MAG: putative histidine kinase, classic [Verrucomicrobiales bacterium]|nr:putative histidine kinase, classic [Verrucomicrobiales bacterium]